MSALLLAMAGALARADDGGIDAQTCGVAQVEILAVDADDFRDACAGVHAALAFFAAHGVALGAPFMLHVTADLPEESGRTAAGSFVEERNRVYMLPYAEYREQKTWFNVGIDRDLYRSVAAHEAAHVVAAANFAITHPTIQGKEYVAYVAMFAAMPPSLRERALAAMPGDGFASEDRITELSYLFDPMRFGAEAYRHYVKPENGAAFLRRVLAGKALAD
jgi:hypothetical protein